MFSLLIIFVLFASVFLSMALFLWLGARWAKVGQVTFHRALAVAIINSVLSILIHLEFQSQSSEASLASILPAMLELAINLIAVWFVIKITFRTSFWRAIISWLPTLIPFAAMCTILLLVLQPHVFDLFVTPTHAMAPTLLGPYRYGICRHCGQPATVSYSPGFDDPNERNPLGICPTCQQAGPISSVSSELHLPDRFMVNKLLSPRRWDVIVFHFPKHPSDLTAKRLIGLPGEEVVIRDGDVWINGARQDPRADIAKLKFAPIPGLSEQAYGTPERPMHLGPDEYFVIGDFSLRSADSRDWGALPGKNIEGVVGLIYWPPTRWRLFR